MATTNHMPTPATPGRVGVQLLKSFIYGAFFISLCAVALCMETSRELGLPFNHLTFYLVVFSATLGQYNFHYLIKNNGVADSERFRWSGEHKQLHLLFNLLGAVGLLIGLIHLNIRHIIALGIIAAITVLYSFPVLPFRKKRRLRDFGLLKILVLSLVWTLITVWFPVIREGSINFAFLIVFATRFLFIFTLCLAFDIRDARIDAAQGTNTIPVALGERMSYRIILVTLLGFAGLCVWLFKINLQFMQFNAMIISATATYFIIEYSRRNHSDMVYLAGIDGMLFLQAMLVLISGLK
ncbi:MAG TPA: UbiA family prenyltransferase [Chitinophagaceae bacterium]|nr:UbiA family prenyltransferase [Chitinophagaceae bacterium]